MCHSPVPGSNGRLRPISARRVATLQFVLRRGRQRAGERRWSGLSLKVAAIGPDWTLPSLFFEEHPRLFSQLPRP